MRSIAKHFAVGGLSLTIALGGCSPKDREECKVKAAKEAPSVASLEILVEDCVRRFPAQREEDGSYTFRDNETGETISVSDPALSGADRKAISDARARHRSEQQASEEAASRYYQQQLIDNPPVAADDARAAAEKTTDEIAAEAEAAADQVAAELGGHP